jgi:hypothetical protein
MGYWERKYKPAGDIGQIGSKRIATNLFFASQFLKDFRVDFEGTSRGLT